MTDLATNAGGLNLPPVRPSAPYAAPAVKPTKPKKEKVKKVLTKSKAAELKESLERRQLGDKTPVVSKDDKKAKTHGKAKTKAVLAKLSKPKANDQLDMVDTGKLKVAAPTDKISKAAQRLKKAIDCLEVATDEKGASVENLVKAMRKAKRYRITVAGMAFELNHVGPKDTIKVVKPK